MPQVQVRQHRFQLDDKTYLISPDQKVADGDYEVEVRKQGGRAVLTITSAPHDHGSEGTTVVGHPSRKPLYIVTAVLVAGAAGVVGIWLWRRRAPAAAAASAPPSAELVTTSPASAPPPPSALSTPGDYAAYQAGYGAASSAQGSFQQALADWAPRGSTVGSADLFQQGWQDRKGGRGPRYAAPAGPPLIAPPTTPPPESPPTPPRYPGGVSPSYPPGTWPPPDGAVINDATTGGGSPGVVGGVPGIPVSWLVSGGGRARREIADQGALVQLGLTAPNWSSTNLVVTTDQLNSLTLGPPIYGSTPAAATTSPQGPQGPGALSDLPPELQQAWNKLVSTVQAQGQTIANLNGALQSFEAAADQSINGTVDSAALLLAAWNLPNGVPQVANMNARYQAVLTQWQNYVNAQNAANRQDYSSAINEIGIANSAANAAAAIPIAGQVIKAVMGVVDQLLGKIIQQPQPVWIRPFTFSFGWQDGCYNMDFVPILSYMEPRAAFVIPGLANKTETLGNTFEGELYKVDKLMKALRSLCTRYPFGPPVPWLLIYRQSDAPDAGVLVAYPTGNLTDANNLFRAMVTWDLSPLGGYPGTDPFAPLFQLLNGVVPPGTQQNGSFTLPNSGNRARPSPSELAAALRQCNCATDLAVVESGDEIVPVAPQSPQPGVTYVSAPQNKPPPWPIRTWVQQQGDPTIYVVSDAQGGTEDAPIMLRALSPAAAYQYGGADWKRLIEPLPAGALTPYLGQVGHPI